MDIHYKHSHYMHNTYKRLHTRSQFTTSPSLKKMCVRNDGYKQVVFARFGIYIYIYSTVVFVIIVIVIRQCLQNLEILIS